MVPVVVAGRTAAVAVALVVAGIRLALVVAVVPVVALAPAVRRR